MPTSDPATKKSFERGITLLRETTNDVPFRVIDCGVGAGYIGRSLRTIGMTKDNGVRVDGIEIFEPYIAKGAMREHLERAVGVFHHLYDTIEIGDFSTLLPKMAPRSANVVVFGDSLEHVEEDVARATLRIARRVAKTGVLVNAPITHYGQGEINGNPHERHLLQWMREEWERQGGIHLGGNTVVGTFLYLPLP